MIDSENAFANGQVYVALSRATTLEGLILTSPLNDRFLGPHANLKFWQETKHDEKSLPMVFEKARQDYMRQMLFNVFSFDHLNFPLEKFKKETEEYMKVPENRNWLNNLSIKYLNTNGTAVKFKQQLQSFWNENPNPESNEKLKTRVVDAAVYFSTQWNEWKQLILDHPLKISTRKESRLVDKLLQEIHEHLVHSLIKIDLCKNGFHSNELATWKKLLPKSIVQPKSSYLPNEKEKTAEQRSGLHELIASYRNEIAEETDTLAYMIFSNQAIKNCCHDLPGDKASLLDVVGFGKQKVKEYGDEVLRLIHEYCEENNIPLNYAGEKLKSKKAIKKSTLLSPTVKETIELFKSGKKLSEICSTRNLAESTIEGHLAIGIKNKVIDIEQLLKKKEIESISEFFSDGSLELNAARLKSEGKVPFGKLRMVQAWLMSNK
ncbi:MAG: helix-turn-helix domain-containing protein [Bacteroidetes bacterium]|nr:helix-turn-helix domain-containing protein [Bacteroidota bacterium]